MTGCGKNADKKEKQDQGRKITYESTVAFVNASSDTLATVRVAVADTPDERNMGLMDVQKLPEDAGMLFLFDHERPQSFWMANTPLSLDIIFINSDHEIVRIHHNTEPFATKQFNSDAPAQYVVETNGGFCVAHDITEGMKVRF